MLEIIKIQIHLLEYASNNLKNNREFIFKAVKIDG
jgi:hypothetical protein